MQALLVGAPLVAPLLAAPAAASAVPATTVLLPAAAPELEIEVAVEPGAPVAMLLLLAHERFLMQTLPACGLQRGQHDSTLADMHNLGCAVRLHSLIAACKPGQGICRVRLEAVLDQKCELMRAPLHMQTACRAAEDSCLVPMWL